MKRLIAMVLFVGSMLGLVSVSFARTCYQPDPVRQNDGMTAIQVKNVDNARAELQAKGIL